ncbi:MAG: hypothetical protein Q9162_000320 [Coniocarpon cinnabarinum]
MASANLLARSPQPQTAKEEYLVKAEAALARQDASIPKHLLLPSAGEARPPRDVTNVPLTSTHFTDFEREIITSSVDTLLTNLAEPKWSSETVTRAFLKAAAVANQYTNCLTELLYDSAIARARELDSFLEANDSAVGFLHGLPVSLKDCFVTPPTPSAVGLTRWAGESTEGVSESVLATALDSLGAVVIAKTNVPVGMMMMETDNHVTGATVNPHNVDCSAGGSSGGEAALLAMRGAPLGIGTDIGGSIRIPSAFCGLFSLKPSFGRLPTFGTRSAIPGNDFVFSVNGPMASDIEALRIYCKAMLGGDPAPWQRDPKCIPMPWRPELGNLKNSRGATGPLNLAFLPPHDSLVHAHPPVARALAQCRDACAKAGHRVSTWQPILHPELCALVNKAFVKLGGPAIGSHLAKTGEPWFKGMQPYADAGIAQAEAQRQGKVDEVFTSDDLREMNLRRNELQKRHLDMWTNSCTDAIIAPVSPWTAVRRGLTTHRADMTHIGYTGVWNLLDVTAGTVPVTKATTEDGWDKVGGKPEAFNEQDEKIMADWDPAFYEGTPVCLQVVGARLQEEKVLAMMQAVKGAIQAHGAA